MVTDGKLQNYNDSLVITLDTTIIFVLLLQLARQ